jgi:ankyrin repeat protein
MIVGLDADHRSVCKFGSATDDDYIQVSRNIVDLVTEATDAFSEREQTTGSDLLQAKTPSLPPTALHDACSEGDLDKISSLLEAKADINAMDSRDFTLLMIACERDDMRVVDFLLSKGADTKRDSSLFNSPISLAIDNGNTEMVTLLFDNGVPIDQRTKMRLSLAEVQITPLGQAAMKGHASLVELILKRNPGPNVNAKLGVLGWTPLHHAVYGRHEAVIRLLLQYKAKIDITYNKGNTPLVPTGYVSNKNSKDGQDWYAKLKTVIEDCTSEGRYSEAAELLAQPQSTINKAVNTAWQQHMLAVAGFIPNPEPLRTPNPQHLPSQSTSVSSTTSLRQPGPGSSRSPPNSQPAYELPTDAGPRAANLQSAVGGRPGYYPQIPGETTRQRSPYAVELPTNGPGTNNPVHPATAANMPTRRRGVNKTEKNCIVS